MKLIINGHEVIGQKGQTILEVALSVGIDIPTLCHDERVETYGACGICVVEAEGANKLFRACSTVASDGMVVHTDTPRVLKCRQSSLDLLLSDHTGDCIAPCTLACPANTDCQGYVNLIADGEHEAAHKLIMEKIPLPSSIGRVCPHPCEDACRRELVEEPIAIATLKRFAADQNLGATYVSTPDESTGKSIAIIGGGPGGLSAAYFLRLRGHDVIVYDAMPHMGGMLRYGIPEYRLPKEVLQTEIDAIEKLGVKLENNVKIGRDLTLDELKEKHDAVLVAVGAWTSVGLRCPGEELEGVFGGIDFLKDVALGNTVNIGDKVAIVGGGNTAMDACRVAVRLGASQVYNIYRRTKNEMPAEQIEIIEAEEEGVIFKNLTNPIEVVGDNGKVCAVRLQVMELGEPDASGRRSPVPVEGKEEVIEIDSIIAAIGQKTDSLGLEALEHTGWRTIKADEHTFLTSINKVFAIGDATNDGADIAITAIAEAGKAADIIDKFVRGKDITQKELFLVKDEKTAEDFADQEHLPRSKTQHRSAGERRGDFLVYDFGFTAEEAMQEASRCLKCGCLDYADCKLIKYANQYDVEPEKYAGKMHCRPESDDIPNVHRTPDKCILCGLCVRLCEESVGAGVLGFVNRGFDTIVQPAGDLSACEDCGKCAEVCPTGALIGT